MTSNQIKYWELQETIRSNQAREREAHRANLAQEAYNFGTLGENVRHNIQVEGINRGELTEKTRHNVATEGETIRSNMASEAIRRDSNSVERSKVNLGYAQLSETERSNKAREYNEQQKINNELYGIFVNREIQERQQAIQLKGVQNEADRNVIEQYKADTAAQRQSAEQEHWNQMDAQGWVRSAVDVVDTVVNDTIKLYNFYGGANNGSLLTIAK